MKIIRFLSQIWNIKKSSKHNCTDCNKANYLTDEVIVGKHTIGFCWNCQHPIWN